MTTAKMTWHTNQWVGDKPYPTRHYAPALRGTNDDILGLPPTQLDRIHAIHEAGHAVVTLAVRGHLHYAKVNASATQPGPGAFGRVDFCGITGGRPAAALFGAGERAEDRWLRETGLWKPERAVAVEMGANGDRLAITEGSPDVGYGDKLIDYRYIHDVADEVLDQHWGAVTRVAAELVRRRHLIGDEIAALVGIVNSGPSRCVS